MSGKPDIPNFLLIYKSFNIIFSRVLSELFLAVEQYKLVTNPTTIFTPSTNVHIYILKSVAVACVSMASPAIFTTPYSYLHYIL